MMLLGYSIIFLKIATHNQNCTVSHQTSPLQLATRDAFEQTTRDVPYLSIWNNDWADANISYIPESPDDLSSEGLAYFGCLFHALFKPSQALELAVFQETHALFGRKLKAGEGYVAAHVRVGGLTGEEQRIQRLGIDPVSAVSDHFFHQGAHSTVLLSFYC